MKVLMVANRYFPGLGGSEIVQQRLAEGLVERGHQVTMLVTDRKYSHGKERIMPDLELVNGVEVIRVPGWRFKKDPLTISPMMMLELIELAKEHDLLYMYGYGYHTSWGPAFLRTFGLLRIPIVFQPHYAPNQNFPSILLKIFDWTLGKLTIEMSDEIVALTDVYHEFFIKMGADKEQLHVIPPIVPPLTEVSQDSIDETMDRYKIPKDKKLILSLGRVVEYKGIHLLFKGFAKLRETDQELFVGSHIVVAGDGDYRSELESLVERLRIEDKVTFTGRVSDEERSVLFHASDVFSLLSYSGESFGVVLVEAMSAGCALLGSNIGAIKGVMKDNVNGKIVHPFDSVAVAEALVELINNEKFTITNRQASKIYQSNNVLDAIEKLLSDLGTT